MYGSNLVSPTWLVVVFVLLITSALAVDARGLKHGRNATNYVNINENKRSYTTHIPTGLEGPVPLVLVLHGLFSNRSYTAWDTAMSRYADMNGAIVVYPKGLGLSWNAGDCCGKAYKSQADDVAFIRAMVADIEQNHQIDKSRVFAAGFSNGAMMCFRLAQEMPDTFAAVASVEGSMRSINQAAKGAVSVLVIHGDNDSVFPYDGGTGRWLRYKIETPAVADEVKYWVTSDHCNQVPSIEATKSFRRELYTQGDDGTEVCLYKVFSNGHFWPGGNEARVFHRLSRSKLNASQTVVEFFLAHPMKSKTPS